MPTPHAPPHKTDLKTRPHAADASRRVGLPPPDRLGIWPHTPAPRQAWFTATGFALLEALLALVLLSLGVLAALGGMALALQTTRQNLLQDQASLLARELAETMQGNPQAAALQPNPYTLARVADAGRPTDSTDSASVTAGSCLSAGRSCPNAGELAQAQREAWWQQVAISLPGARAEVCQDSQPYDGAGRPQWHCDSAPARDTPLLIKLGWPLPAQQLPNGATELAGTPSRGPALPNTRPRIVLSFAAAPRT